MIHSIERAASGLIAFGKERDLHDEPRIRDAVYMLHWVSACLAKHRCVAEGGHSNNGPCKGHGEEKGHGTCVMCGGHYGGGLFEPRPTGRERILMNKIAELEARVVEMRQRETRR